MKFKIRLKKYEFLKKINTIINFILAFMFFPPDILRVDEHFEFLYKTINYSSWLLAICIVIFCGSLYLLGKRKNIIDAKSLLLLLFFFILIFSTILHGDSTRAILMFATKVIALDLLLYYFYCRRKHIYFLHDLYIYLFIMIACNLASQILIPNGIVEPSGVNWQPYFICANANNYVFIYIFTLAIGSIVELKAYSTIKIDVYLLWMIELYSMLMSDTSTGLIAVLLAGVYLFVIIKMPIKKLLKRIRIILIILIIIFCYFVYFNHGDEVANYLKILTGEDVSFSARMYIWKTAVEGIKLHPLFGYGTAAANLAYDDSGLTRSAHDNYLEILIQGGFIGASMYVLFLYRSLVDIVKQKSIISDLKFLIVYFIIIYLIVFFVEQNPTFIGFYFLLLLGRVLVSNDST